MPFLMTIPGKGEEVIYAIADGPPERDLAVTMDDALEAGPDDDADLDLESHPVVRASSAAEALERFVRRGLDRAAVTCSPALANELIGSKIASSEWSDQTAATFAVYSDQLGSQVALGDDNYFAWMFYRSCYRFLRAQGLLFQSLHTHEVEVSTKRKPGSTRPISLWGLDAQGGGRGSISANFALERGKEVIFLAGDDDCRRFLSGGKPGTAASIQLHNEGDERDRQRTPFGARVPRMVVTQKGRRASPTQALLQCATLGLTGASALLGHDQPLPVPSFQFLLAFGDIKFNASVSLFGRDEVTSFVKGT